MAASKAVVNWSSVIWNSIPITRITTGSFGLGAQLIKFKGDGDIYPSVVVCPTIEPHASFTSADPYTVFNTSAPGTAASLVAVLADAKKATGGNLTFTMANAVWENADASGQHAQFGQSTFTFQATTADGQTNPLTFAEA
jgi:hypothetical protein